MPTRRDVLKTGAGLAILSVLPGGLGSAHAATVSGPSFGTRNPLGLPQSHYSDVKNGLGCLISRNDVQWANFEVTKGSYNWGGLDRVIGYCEEAGLKVLIPITGPRPSWAGGGYAAPSGEILTSYVNACRAIAYRYSDKTCVEAYEIWNEPNGHGPTGAWSPAQYITVINAVAPAIRAADPNVLVAGPGMARLPGDGGPFAKIILADAQARANLDVFTGHAYCRPAAPEIGTSLRGPFDRRVAASLTVLANAGFNKPFWVTEMGWNTAGNAQINSLDDQARYIVRGAIIIRAHGVRVYQFEYDGGLGIGMLGKPSYAAYKTLNSIVGNELTSLTKVTHPTAWVYKFTRKTLPIGYVLWTVSGTANVTLTGLTARVRKTTISGISTIVDASGGEFAAGIDPIYIENI